MTKKWFNRSICGLATSGILLLLMFWLEEIFPITLLWRAMQITVFASFVVFGVIHVWSQKRFYTDEPDGKTCTVYRWNTRSGKEERIRQFDSEAEAARYIAERYQESITTADDTCYFFTKE